MERQDQIEQPDRPWMQITTRIPVEDYERLAALAEAEQRSMSNMLNVVVRKFCADRQAA
jgi:predicted DNA-binding protein